MKKLICKIFLNKKMIVISIYFGLVNSFLFKNVLTQLLFSGLRFEGRSYLYQFILFVAYTLFFTLIWFVAINNSVVFQKQIYKFEQNIDKCKYLFRNDAKKRIGVTLVSIGIGICLIFIVNNLLAHINTVTWQYETKNIIPIMKPIGNDFRVGLYTPAQNLIKTNFKSIGLDGSFISIYPPLVSVVSLVYLIFNYETAYLIHVGLLILANTACLGLASLMVKELVLPGLKLESFYISLIAGFLFFVMAVYTFSSYSFIFAMERGNVDIFAMLFSMLTMWCLLKRPGRIWLQVVLLSIAVHFKIYPAALFVILLYRHGKKIFLPAISVNLAFLLILGPRFALGFIRALTSGSGIGGGVGNKWTGILNHSSYSFSDSLTKIFSNLSSNLFLLWGFFTLVPLLLWVIAMYKLIKKTNQTENIVLMLMVTVPFMDLVPTISMDYKLVILNTSILILIALILKNIFQKPSWIELFQLSLLFVIMLFIGRPYAMSEKNMYLLKESEMFLINNKYLWVLALEFLMVFAIYRKYTLDKIDILNSKNK